jgi:hypothetical protein
MTPKQRVLARFPKAYIAYRGLSLKFEIVSNFGGRKLSAPRLRQRDAWADAAKKIDKAKRRRNDGTAK